MKRLILIIVLLILFAVNNFLHFWEYRKICEFRETFKLQSEMEVKRTSLMVIYQEVLQNVVREVDALKNNSTRPNFGLPNEEE